MLNNQIKILCITFFILFFCSRAISQDKPFVIIQPGMEITKDIFAAPYEYDFFLTDFSPIIITGENITIDFAGATFYGSDADKSPDQYNGIALIIRDAKNVRIQNLRIHGFKTALLIENSYDLIIKNCDFSYNYRPRLYSYRTHEVVSDWISLHNNDSDEWLAHGPAVYLKNVSRSIFESLRITGCQHGLLMSNSHNNYVINSFIHFNSGVGIGLYRSNYNEIYHNFLDYNVRGYSHGFYRRGQDSSGILLFEQCQYNIIAYNSITHSGDGIFLWGGRETLDSGEGGSNHNFIYKNDVSYAPTNGIEVTFSINSLIENKIKDCVHGIWGGYSHNTIIQNNLFEDNKIGIAIEHGNGNVIRNNNFRNDEVGIKLWQRNKGSIPWQGIASKDKFNNQNTIVAGNYLEQVPTPFSVADGRMIMIHENTIDHAFSFVKSGGRNRNVSIRKNNYWNYKGKKPGLFSRWRNDFSSGSPPPARFESYSDIPNMQLPSYPLNTEIWPYMYKGLESIIITQWGPYDFRYPYVHVLAETDSTSTLRVLGPSNSAWTVRETQGIYSLNKQSGRFGDTLIVTKNSSLSTSIIRFKYTGQPFIDQLGRGIGEQEDFYFYYRGVNIKESWKMTYFEAENLELLPVPDKDLSQIILREDADFLNKNWWVFKAGDGTNRERFLCHAKGSIQLSAGQYNLLINALGKVLVYAEGQLIFDGWNIELEYPITIPVISGGSQVELDIYYQNSGGFSTLCARILND